MDSIQSIYTKRRYHPGSLLIRCANPVSFVKIAPVSHVITVDGNTGFGLEANMLHGVRRAPLEEILKGQTIVARRWHQVPDAEAGLSWARETAEGGAEYDFLGALGLGLDPDREWQSEEDWFCFEFSSGILAKAGRVPFIKKSRVTGYMLMSLPENL